ncbi:hypothetical protein [Helicobacter sp. T3_23-1059]
MMILPPPSPIRRGIGEFTSSLKADFTKIRVAIHYLRIAVWIATNLLAQILAMTKTVEL